MALTATNDITKWAEGLSGWKRDALRRLACSSDLTDADKDQLLLLAKKAAGFDCPDDQLPDITPLQKSHISTPSGTNNVQIRALKNIQSVNQLTPSAALNFGLDKLTVIYGRNGSGKSGFVRILRSACRTRLVNEKDIKILSDVYGASDTPQSAEIVIENSTGTQTLDWSNSSPAHDDLQHIAVFDSKSAQMYIDAGNQIRFLPFGLDLPEKLNKLCLEFKKTLQSERQTLEQDLAIKSIKFTEDRVSLSKLFYEQLSGDLTDAEIDKACNISASDRADQKNLAEGLIANSLAIRNHKNLLIFTEGLADECKALTEGLNDAAFAIATKTIKNAKEARAAADLAASEGLNKEPLTGVASSAWKLMWEAAKTYSVEHAYPDKGFPVLEHTPDPACVLCQQKLEPPAINRMQRFQEYMNSTLKTQADNKKNIVSSLLSNLPKLDMFLAADFDDKLAHLQEAHEDVAKSVETFKENIIVRHKLMLGILNNIEEINGGVIPLPNIEDNLREVSARARELAFALESADEPDNKALLLKRRDDLADHILLADNKDVILARRDLLKTQALHTKLWDEFNTTKTTMKSTQLIEKHVTESVQDRFRSEQGNFGISHLKITLVRKTNKGVAEFTTDPGTALTKRTSEILSEGEQRALALSAFFTEIAVCEGNGSIIFDDPVSSLDRERGQKVANRIVQEAKCRQVIVFTHDIVFLNQLRKAAHQKSVQDDYQHVFRYGNQSGKVDPNGLPWKGKSIKQRVSAMKQRLQEKKKLFKNSSSEWETEVKGLYGNLRDTYERMVEEDIFHNVVQRNTDAVSTMMLRKVKLSDGIAIKFHTNYSKISSHCHDNPTGESITTPTPDEFLEDLAAFEKLRKETIVESDTTEKSRPSMKQMS